MYGFPVTLLATETYWFRHHAPNRLYVACMLALYDI